MLTIELCSIQPKIYIFKIKWTVKNNINLYTVIVQLYLTIFTLD